MLQTRFLETGVSEPTWAQGEGVSSQMMRSVENPQAGDYAFPLDGVKAGRYYVMYQAKNGYRISGNVLPLERKQAEDGLNFDCIPKGGEGSEYMKEVQEKGDLDLGGYCARSIGCLEVGIKSDMEEVYRDMQVLNGRHDLYDGTSTNLVALPSRSTLSVGLSEEEWPLKTNQRADAEIVLRFPSTVTKEDLSAAVTQDFATSEVKRNLETAIAKEFNKGNPIFVTQGVALLTGVISQASEETPPSRMLRGLQTDVPAAPQDTAAGARAQQITYTLTTWGSYNPPPFEQLGTIVSDSINADPEGLVKSLRDKESGLPPVFEEVDELKARHLTTKVENVQQFNEQSKGLASWATVPTILMAFMILVLTGLLLWRRVFTRRVHKGKKDPFKDYPLTEPLRMGSDFNIAKFHPEDEKKKSNKGSNDPPGDKIAGVSEDGTFVMQPVSPESLDDNQSPHSRSTPYSSSFRAPSRSHNSSHTSSNTSSRSAPSNTRSFQSVNTQGSQNIQGLPSLQSSGQSKTKSVLTQSSQSAPIDASALREKKRKKKAKKERKERSNVQFVNEY